MLAFNYTLSVFLMIVLPVLFAALLRRRWRPESGRSVAWWLFCVGILTFIVSQVVHLPLNDWLMEIKLLGQPGLDDSHPLWWNAMLLGLTAGLCEELARALGLFLLTAVLRRRQGAAPQWTLGQGLMLGLGHGGIEAMFFGGVLVAATVGSLLTLQGVDLSTLVSSPEQLAALQLQMQRFFGDPWLAYAPLVERLLAMGLHVTLSVMVLRAFQKRNPLYLLLAIAYHTLVDFVAVMLASAGWAASAGSLGAWAVEGLLLLTMLPGYLWLAWTLRREAPPAPTATPLRRELALFGVALRKELLQQWRTRRLLIVAAVFGLFGLSSPLVAYFTPQMLMAIPGAESFADLVPTPTAADAMVQYSKNLTQFGFLLALLLGMGAVAGEKERGTASLVLSKPMTRWGFVASKLVAQLAVYLLGFMLALPGAYIYTVVLFGDLQFGPFALLNLVLFFWLLPYVAVTLVGSVLANTTNAAAGLGLVGVVGLLIASGIPQIAGLLPGALAGWAGQLGSQAAGGLEALGQAAAQISGPATGALAFSFMLTLVCLVTAIAIFEQQEL